jgi:hypothetical protein
MAPGVMGCGQLVIAALGLAVAYGIARLTDKDKKGIFVIRNPDPEVPIVALSFRATPDDEPFDVDVVVPPGGRSHWVDVDWSGPDGFYDVLATWADGREARIDRVVLDSHDGSPIPLDFAVPPRR